MENNEQNVQNETTEVVEEKIETTKVEESTVSEVKEAPVMGSYKKQKKGIPGFVIGLIALVVVLVGALLVYKFVYATPKNIFLKTMNKGYANIEKNLDVTDNTLIDVLEGKSFKLSMNVDADIDVADGLLEDDAEEIIDLINDLTADMGITVSEDYKKLDLNVELSDTTDKLELGAYLRDSNVYVDLKDLYSKYIKVAIETEKGEQTEAETMNMDDAKYIVKAVKDSFLNSLDGNKFKSADKKLTINEKEVKTTKISYTIDKNEIAKVLKKTITNMKNDNKLIEKLAKYSGESKEDIKSSLEEAAKEIEKADMSSMGDTAIVLSTYTTGITNDVVGYSLALKTSDTDVELVYYNYNKAKTIKLLSGDMTIVTLINKEIKENEYNTVVTALTAKLNIDTVISDNGSKSTFKLTESTSGIDLSGELSLEDKELEKEKKYEYKADLKATLKVEDEEAFTAKLNTKSNLVIGAELKEISENNAIDYTELTQTDLDNILTKLESNSLITKVVDMFESKNISTPSTSIPTTLPNSDEDYLSCYKYNDDDYYSLKYYYGSDNKVTSTTAYITFSYDSKEDMEAAYNDVESKYPSSKGYTVTKGYAMITVTGDINSDNGKDVDDIETAQELEEYSCY